MSKGVPAALRSKWVAMNYLISFFLAGYIAFLPIAYLRTALDNFYCHHEKWDGTGYPRGLKGEQIPIAARIFALADIWDALISDRRYREAWSREKVEKYFRSQAGKHFDPHLVELFLANVVDR